MGLDVFKAEVETRAGISFQPARPFSFDSNVDVFGWTKGLRGKNHYTVFIENGRVQDEPGRDFKTGLREIAQVHKGTFRLTANQHVIIADVPDDQVPVITKLLAKYKLDNMTHSALRLSSSSCVAFPTCGLAMAESERVSCILSRMQRFPISLTTFLVLQYLPILIDKVEKICEEHGLRNDSIVMRMTGCPNGCARPYVAGASRSFNDLSTF
jgi:sulfite reductase (NADPH) hemoprotein beta-component